MGEEKDNFYTVPIVIPIKNQELIRKIHEFENIEKQCDFAYEVKKIDVEQRKNKRKYYLRLIEKGKGVARIGNTTHILKPGSIIIINPEQPHLISMDHSQEIDTYTIIFKEESINEIFAILKQKDTKIMDYPDFFEKECVEFENQHIQRDSNIANLVKKAIIGEPDAFAGDFARQLYLKEILYYLFSHEFHEYVSKIQNNGSRSKNLNSEIERRISLIIDFLHENITNKITIKQLSEIACLSEAHLIRLFKEYTGTSPYQYVVNLRLEKAKELLENHSMTITEIAFYLGYPTLASFTKAFKVYSGISPSEYRKD